MEMIGETTEKKRQTTCPICYEEKLNMVPIPHWEQKGDISGHVMCQECFDNYGKNECPFCREISIKDDLMSLINDIVRDIKGRCNGQCHPDHLASLLERWQLLEMEHESNPRILCRIAKIFIQDDELKTHLQYGIEMRSEWLRDASGIFFRLYSLSSDGDLDISKSDQKLLKKVYDTVMKKIMPRMEVSGHHYGALYTQAAVPCISAIRSGVGVTEMKNIVKDVGSLIVQLYEKNKHVHFNLRTEIPERMEECYVSVLTQEVWGGVQHDPVFQAFYA